MTDRLPDGALARLQQSIVFAALLLTLSASFALWRTGHSAWALLALLTVPVAHAAVLAAEFIWMRRVNASELGMVVPWRTVVDAWRLECVHALQVFGLWQPFLSGRIPDHVPDGAGGRRGVVLVHGFVCNRGLWRPWLSRLQAADIPCIAVNLQPVFTGIDGYASVVDAAVRRMEQATGLAPVVVGHSMGGLVLRRWWRDVDASRVHRLITIGSPHRGTRIARFAVVANAVQMRHQSDWVTQLAAAEIEDRRRRTICFYSDCDNIVFPADSATLAGADNRMLSGVGHISLARRGECWNALMTALGRADPRGCAPH